MQEKEIILTPDGLKKLEEKLHHYKSHQRKEVAERIRQAKEFGEIGENSEYEDAKAEQSFVEGEIANLDNLIRHARVIDEKEVHTDIVSLGSTVSIENIKNNEKLEFTIVGTAESDPSQKKISNESPMGMALINRKKNQIVDVKTPAGKSQYKILKISKKIF
ncbi:MAG: transcription elongation factor GreA [Armatimonadetes bacterium]|nr:transcription elongation factor GreA [Armatimonadota bacterium]